MRLARAILGIVFFAAAAPIASATVRRPVIPEQQSVLTLPGGSNCGIGPAVEYGGTVWDATDVRWEAIQGGVWTFNTGTGSWINSGADPNKPIEYHEGMEGWTGLDLTLAAQVPYFRRSTTCAISGGYSFWAGVTAVEAANLCFAGGAGYGNDWHMELTKSFTYPGTGEVVDLSFRYAVASEPDRDLLQVLIQAGSWPQQLLWVGSGNSSGTKAIRLRPGETLPTGAGPFTITFLVTSDDTYSDQDGGYTTSCGHSVIDDITLTLRPSGSVLNSSDFETSSDGWVSRTPTTGVGDYSNVVSLSADLPPPLTFCTCGMSDSVLTFNDTFGQHPVDQSNVAVSPIIQLPPADQGQAGRYIKMDYYLEAPLANYVFLQLMARSTPEVGCNATNAPFRPLETVLYGGDLPFCTPAPCLFDVSHLIDFRASEVQIAVGVMNLCRIEPFGVPCTGVTNTTPWIDNVSFGIYGGDVPIVHIDPEDMLQDNFAADGTLNSGSTGRVDSALIKQGWDLWNLAPSLGDTLVVRGGGYDSQVTVVFRVRPGPSTNLSALNTWAADHLGGSGAVSRWVFDAPTTGSYFNSAWYRARMDTAEQGGIPQPGAWMSTVHEAQIFPPNGPGAPPNWDRSIYPPYSGRLKAEIFPDYILTPGSRIDYYIRATNPAGTCTYTLPAGVAEYFEMEILPSSMMSDATWNCTLYVDHHADRASKERAVEEQGLALALGAGGGNAEGTNYDRYDVNASGAGHASFGRPLESLFGASIIQTFGYNTIVWHASDQGSFSLTSSDADMLGAWLALSRGGARNFWGTGQNLVTGMNGSASPSVQNFMRNTLGILRTCDTIRNVNCPTGTVSDATSCLPVGDVAGSYFTNSGPNYACGNGCPDAFSFDLLNTNSSMTTARGQMTYVKSGTPRNYASVANYATNTTGYKTVIDGFGIGRLRSDAGYLDVTAARQRAADVLGWFGAAASLFCQHVPAIDQVPPGPPEDGSTPPGAALGPPTPNPMRSRASISFTTRTADAPARLVVFDVSGRLVRTLVDSRLPSGRHDAEWDGRADDGARLPAGLYFYRLTTPDSPKPLTRKILVIP